MHRFPHVQTEHLPITDGDIDLSAPNLFNHMVLQIHQVIKMSALDADPVILRAVRQRMTFQDHGAVLQIQKAQGLKL